MYEGGHRVFADFVLSSCFGHGFWVSQATGEHFDCAAYGPAEDGGSFRFEEHVVEVCNAVAFWDDVFEWDLSDSSPERRASFADFG